MILTEQFFYIELFLECENLWNTFYLVKNATSKIGMELNIKRKSDWAVYRNRDNIKYGY